MIAMVAFSESEQTMKYFVKHIALTQYGMKKGLQLFGDRGVEVIRVEMFHNRVFVSPIDPKNDDEEDNVGNVATDDDNFDQVQAHNGKTHNATKSIERRKESKKKYKSRIIKSLITIVMMMIYNENMLQPDGSIKQFGPDSKESDGIKHVRPIDILIDRVKRRETTAVGKIDNNSSIGIKTVNKIEIRNDKRGFGIDPKAMTKEDKNRALEHLMFPQGDRCGMIISFEKEREVKFTMCDCLRRMFEELPNKMMRMSEQPTAGHLF